MLGTAFVMTAIINKTFFNCTDFNPSPRQDIAGESELVYGAFGYNGCGTKIFIRKHKSDNDLIYFPLWKLDESSKFGLDARPHTDSKQIWIVIPGGSATIWENYPDL